MTSPRLVPVPRSQTTRNCRIREGAGGALLNEQSQATFAQSTDACVAVGAHVGHNPATTADTRAAVLGFLRETLSK